MNSRISRTLGCALLLIALASPPAHADFEYVDFLGAADLNTLGAANIVGSDLILTPALGGQVGGAHHTVEQDLTLGFDTIFDFQLSSDGADGFTFLIQAVGPDTLGLGTGSTLGYAEGSTQCGYSPAIDGLPQSCAIEFDSWDSGACWNEPGTARHIAVQPSLGPNQGNWNLRAGGTSTPPNWEDTALHTVRIEYDHSVPVMRVYLDDLDNALFEAPFDLPAAIGSDTAWVGFSATTGGVTSEHKIYSWSYVNGTGGPGGTFRRGDSNNDSTFDVSDVVYLLGALFIPGSPQAPCLDAADMNDDGVTDVSDSVFALAALFIPSSPEPPAPGPLSCGADPTADALDTCDQTSCP
ncbi:MAG: hypothetical protein AAF488_01050 [Planctomycetota bacterium]